MTEFYEKNTYSVVEEIVVSPIHTGPWYKIAGPHGLSHQAYINKTDAEKIVNEKNQKPYFNPKAFCKDINDK